MDFKDNVEGFDNLLQQAGISTEVPTAQAVTPTVSTTESDVEDSLDGFNKLIGGASPVEEDADTSVFAPEEDSLSKTDLKTGTNAARIRQYMVDRHGVDYRAGAGKSDDEVVEDFVDRMRWFNSNIVSAAGEARYIGNATDTQKQNAAEAYKLYDRLGNVFTNDGFMGAVDGVKDYIFATAADPTTWIGLVTGGAAKAGGAGFTAAGRMAVKRAAVKAGQEAVAKGATREAAAQAGRQAAEKAASRMAAAGVKDMKSKGVRAALARAESAERATFLKEAKLRAQREVMREGAAAAAKKAVVATTIADSTFAVLHDVTLQNTLIETGAQEEYSASQTAFSSLLGGIGGGAQLAMGKFSGASGLADADISLRIGTDRIEEAKRAGDFIDTATKRTERVQVDLTPDEAGKVATDILSKAKSWAQKVKDGEDAFDDVPTSVEFIRDVMIGSDGNGGIAKMMKDLGKPLPKGVHISDVATTLVRELPGDRLREINEALKPMGINLGDATQIRHSLKDLLAVEISKSGKVLNVMSQMRKTLDAAAAYSHEVLEGQSRTIDILDQEAAKAKKMKGFTYGQNIWRRLLVSSTSTTAINVMGFAQYYAGQTMADLFSMTGHTLAGLAKGGPLTKAGRESLNTGKIYAQIQTQKIRNLLDPYTTHDAYMAFLEQHPDASKVLFESFTGGVTRSGKRFGIDPDAKWFQRTEAVVDGVNRVTGVKIQDTFTKSQMFITEMDKWLRLNKGTSLEEVMTTGKLDLIDDDVMGASLDSTLKSVFSKDYTTEQTPELLRASAKIVEQFSNTPVIGTILPFGRFFNNVLATSYQWSVGGGVQMAGAMYNRAIKGAPIPKTTTEAFARSLVGVTSLRLAMEFDEERQAQGLDTFNLDVGGGNIMNAQNMFPFSLWLAVGRAGNLARKGERVPDELIQDISAQLAVGQFAKDSQFGNDLYNAFDVAFNGSEGERQASLDALYKIGGNFFAGFTRPLDAVNKMVGLIHGSDAAKDVRQASGVSLGVQTATKYVDNVIELFTDKLESVTGEELRVATRDGSIRDINPVLSLMGIKLEPSRTGTEKAFTMAGMHDYTASERTAIPAYDRIFNESIAPYFEQEYLKLVESDEFKKATMAERRNKVKAFKTYITGQMRKYLKGNASPHKLLGAQRAATTIGDKDKRFRALKEMREQHGYSGSGPKEMNWEELNLFHNLVDYYTEIDKFSKPK